MPVSIKYGAYAFTTTGRAQYARKDTYEADAPGGRPQRRRTVWTIAQIFQEPSYADNAARYRALLTALQTTEAVLAIVDENGTTVASLRARPLDGDWPEQWGQHLAEVKVSFATSEDLAKDPTDIFTATYTPTGGAAVTLVNVTGFRTDLKSDRFSTAVPNRRETNCLISLQGKIRADPQQSVGMRRTELLRQRGLIDWLDSKSGVLKFADFSETVRVDSAVAELKDAADELEYSISASYRKFPSGDYAEAEYSFTQTDDPTSHERTTSVQGKVRADDEAGAKTKAEALRDLAAAGGGQLRKSQWGAQRIDGQDGTAFTEGSFSYEYRELLATTGASWKLTVTSKDDLKSGAVQKSYTGSATAATSAAALKAARDAGDGKHTIRLTSSEAVETVNIDGKEQFVQVSFAYEYLTKGALSFAEVNSDTSIPTFGSSVGTVQGTATAATEAAALVLARGFKLSGLLLRDSKETVEKVHRGAGSQFSKVSFAYAFHKPATSGSIQYAKKTAENTDTREITTSWSGTAWAANEATANALITALIAGHTGRSGGDERTSNWDKSASHTAFISRSFSLARISPMAAGDVSILSAESSVETTSSVNHAVITPIPFGTPHVQTNCGMTPGMRVVTGSCTAMDAATAQSWGRSQNLGGGYPDPSQEKLTTVYVPQSGTKVKAYRFDFTYSARTV